MNKPLPPLSSSPGLDNIESGSLTSTTNTGPQPSTNNNGSNNNNNGNTLPHLSSLALAYNFSPSGGGGGGPPNPDLGLDDTSPSKRGLHPSDLLTSPPTNSPDVSRLLEDYRSGELKIKSSADGVLAESLLNTDSNGSCELLWTHFTCFTRECRTMVLFRHGAKSSIAEEERLWLHALVVRLHAHLINVVIILTPETAGTVGVFEQYPG